MPEQFEDMPEDEWKATLLGNVHPADWQNPAPSGRYNLVVIGAGTAGLVTAAGAAGLGARVALVERSLMGGDCLNYGCVPSKAILSAARSAAKARSAPALGIHTGPVSADFSAVMARMRRLRAGISRHDSAARFTDLGVDVFIGDATFEDGSTVVVDDQRLVFSKAVIATGARAAAPNVEGLDTVDYLTNETIFSLTACPASMTIIGSGPIGCEMAQAFQRLGSRVTLIEKSDHVLPREDADAAALVQEALVRDGVQLVFQAKVTRAEASGDGKTIHVETPDGPQVFTADTVLVAAGRAPNVEGLGLEKAGVSYDLRTGIQVDDTLRTSNKRIYAAGDVCMAHKFTHAADFAARTVIRNTLFPFLPKSKLSALVIPWCTYTDPEVARVGLSEGAAREGGIEVDTYKVALADVDRAVLEGETEGFAKVICARGKDRILGATLVGSHAGESIGELVVAMRQGIGLGALANVIHPYPTQAEAIRKAGDVFNKTRLTPTVATLFRKLIALQR
jgi:pyruvate/2-oxoglutarate dehydrogenase complex dihydrolipoamide dehydrogenase (E3) component